MHIESFGTCRPIDPSEIHVKAFPRYGDTRNKLEAQLQRYDTAITIQEKRATLSEFISVIYSSKRQVDLDEYRNFGERYVDDIIWPNLDDIFKCQDAPSQGMLISELIEDLQLLEELRASVLIPAEQLRAFLLIREERFPFKQEYDGWMRALKKILGLDGLETAHVMA